MTIQAPKISPGLAAAASKLLPPTTAKPETAEAAAASGSAAPDHFSYSSASLKRDGLMGLMLLGSAIIPDHVPYSQPFFYGVAGVGAFAGWNEFKEGKNVKNGQEAFNGLAHMTAAAAIAGSTFLTNPWAHLVCIGIGGVTLAAKASVDDPLIIGKFFVEQTGNLLKDGGQAAVDLFKYGETRKAQEKAKVKLEPHDLSQSANSLKRDGYLALLQIGSVFVPGLIPYGGLAFAGLGACSALDGFGEFKEGLRNSKGREIFNGIAHMAVGGAVITSAATSNTLWHLTATGLAMTFLGAKASIDNPPLIAKYIGKEMLELGKDALKGIGYSFNGSKKDDEAPKA